MTIEEMKARLRTLLYQRDDAAAWSFFDLRSEIEEEIRKLTRELRKIA